MPEAIANDVTIYYETDGNPSDPPLLLVMGLGAQMTAWHPDFRAALVKRGFFVISFDNRDAGRSSWFDQFGPADPFAAFAGTVTAPYLLTDMANDAFSVLDALDIPAAHVLGVSMGGMIVQTMAIEHPERVLTMTSVMSTTGDLSVGQARPEIMAVLMRPPAADKASAVEQGVSTSRTISSPGFPFDEEGVRAHIAANYDRGYHPEGTARQLVGVICSGDRTAGLRQLDVPTLVIHGEGDPLVDVSGGRATADAIPGATLKLVPGMGHDLPPVLFDEMADAVADHISQAGVTR